MSESKYALVSTHHLAAAANRIMSALRARDIRPGVLNTMAITFLGLSAMEDSGMTKDEARTNVEKLLDVVFDDAPKGGPRGH